MAPLQLLGDFEDLAAWRQGVYEVLDLSLRSYEGVVIAPMTLIGVRPILPGSRPIGRTGCSSR